VFGFLFFLLFSFGFRGESFDFFLRLRERGRGGGAPAAHKTKAVYHPVCFVLLSASEMRKDRPLKGLCPTEFRLFSMCKDPVGVLDLLLGVL
jgi:hypothetical protein